MHKPTITITKRIAVATSIAAVVATGTLASFGAGPGVQLTSETGQGSYVYCPPVLSGVQTVVGSNGCSIPAPSDPPALSYSHGVCTVGGQVVSTSTCVPVTTKQVETFVHAVANQFASHETLIPAAAVYSLLISTYFPQLVSH